ncbi:MAG: hypothetical protein IKR73_08500 [Oscillospiraceae bacterium]|nr:hypothetical protein [Oscillospiraceae bacterium]
MPFIHFMTNTAVSDAEKNDLKAALGQAITAIPGKSEGWLMVRISDGCSLYFKGDPAPAAMVEVTVFGHADHNAYTELTKRICAIAEGMSIPASRVYVRYAETDEWGWNGMNF